MSYKLSKYDAIEQVKRLRIDNIMFYIDIDGLHSTTDNRIKWITEFIEYLSNDYVGNHNGLRACADEFNKHYWIPKSRNGWSDQLIMQTAFRKHEKAIKEVVDSFLKMCDYIEESNKIGCIRCPIQNDCFYKDKHKGLLELMNKLGIERRKI